MFIVFGNLISAQVNHYFSLLGLRTITRSCGLIILTIICIKQSIKMPNKMKTLVENGLQIVVCKTKTFYYNIL